MIALVVTQTMSANADTLRRTLTSVAEGIVLTMASVAPWLFSGVMLGIIVAMFCGLPPYVREFRADLRRERAGGAGVTRTEGDETPRHRPASGRPRRPAPPAA